MEELWRGGLALHGSEGGLIDIIILLIRSGDLWLRSLVPGGGGSNGLIDIIILKIINYCYYIKIINYKSLIFMIVGGGPRAG